MTEKLVTCILEYIEQNLNERIMIDDISKEFNYDKYYIQRIFKRQLNITIKEYINERKIIKSISKIINTDDKILKIALNNGFNSLEYYSEIFLKITSYSPLSFRKSYLLKEKCQFKYTNNLLSDYYENHKIIIKIINTNKESKKLTKQIKKVK